MPRHYSAMVALDFDGTLLRQDGQLNETDLLALSQLESQNVLRAVVTGRNLMSFEKACARLPPIPIDYLVFSTGIGIVTWPDKKLVKRAGLDEHTTSQAEALFEQLGIDYTHHEPVPDNHRFTYYRHDKPNLDLDARLALYANVSQPKGIDCDSTPAAAQLVGMITPGDAEVYEQVRNLLAPSCSVIRTTSPIDQHSLWIEVLPAGVDKGSAARWLAERHTIPQARTFAIGNDYNDCHLLDWAANAFVVANAPQELRSRYPVVASNDSAGVAEVLAKMS